MHFLHTSSQNKDHRKYLSQGCSSDCLDNHHQTYILDVPPLKHNDSTQLLSQKTIMLFFMFHLPLKVFNFAVLYSHYGLQMPTRNSVSIDNYNTVNDKTQLYLFCSFYGK